MSHAGTDRKKRLLISAWRSDESISEPVMLGCMSFGMKNLCAKSDTKKIDGRYYLLPCDVGQKKHLLVPNSLLLSGINASACSVENTPISRTSNQSSSSSAPSSILSHNHQQMTAIEVVLQKQPYGFGFTIKHDCPVMIGRVKAIGAAREAGLKRGDFIEKINGQNVSRSCSHSVARIIRLTEEILVLNVVRFSGHRTPSRDEHIPYADENIFPTNLANNLLLTRHSTKEKVFEVKVTPISAVQNSDNSDHQPSRHSVVSKCSSTSRHSHPRSKHGSISRRSIEEEEMFLNGISRKRSKLSHTTPSLPPTTLPHTSLILPPTTLPTVTPSSVRTYSSLVKSTSKKHETSDRFHTDIITGYNNNDFCLSRNKPKTKGFSLNGDSNNTHNFSDLFCNTTILTDVVRVSSNALNRAFVYESKRNKNSLDVTRWDPYLSVIVKSDSMIQQDADLLHSHDVTWSPESSPSSDSSSVERSEDRSSDYFSYSSDSLQETCKTVDRSFVKEHSVLSVVFEEREPVSRRVCRTQLPAILEHSLKVHTSCIDYIKSREIQFIRDLLNGSQRFSRPLRHQILSSQEHSGLFLNIEKIIKLSEFLVSGLNETRSRNMNLVDEENYSTVGTVYMSKLNMLMDCYENYLHGLTSSTDLLLNLKASSLQFAAFLQQESDNFMAIEEFIRLPKEHIVDICAIMSRQLACLPITDPEHGRLITIVKSLNRLLFKENQQMMQFVLESSTGELSSTNGLSVLYSDSMSSGAYSGVDGSKINSSMSSGAYSGVDGSRTNSSSSIADRSGGSRLMTA